MSELEENDAIAEQICAELTWREFTFSQGQFVGLLDGNVVAVEPDALSAIDKVRNLESNPQRGMVFKVGPAEVDVIRRG